MMSNIQLRTNGRVAKIIINRPEVLNVLNRETVMVLGEQLKEISKDKKIRCVIITGAGDSAFAAGADIKEMLEFEPLQASEYAKRGHDIFHHIEQMPQVVIAAINGFALGGGCELALACDLRYASKTAKLGLPETNLGIIPGYGGTQRLPRLVGMSKAKEMIFTGEMIDATEAYRIGLVNKVYPPQELIKSVETIAEKIASKGYDTLRLAKDSINASAKTDIKTGCNFEIMAFGLNFASEDQYEGMSAFLEKRKPKFK